MILVHPKLVWNNQQSHLTPRIRSAVSPLELLLVTRKLFLKQINNGSAHEVSPNDRDGTKYVAHLRGVECTHNFYFRRFF
jgi:hypothetical protein